MTGWDALMLWLADVAAQWEEAERADGTVAEKRVDL